MSPRANRFEIPCPACRLLGARCSLHRPPPKHLPPPVRGCPGCELNGRFCFDEIVHTRVRARSA